MGKLSRELLAGKGRLKLPVEMICEELEAIAYAFLKTGGSVRETQCSYTLEILPRCLAFLFVEGVGQWGPIPRERACCRHRESFSRCLFEDSSSTACLTRERLTRELSLNSNIRRGTSRVAAPLCVLCYMCVRGLLGFVLFCFIPPTPPCRPK